MGHHPMVLAGTWPYDRRSGLPAGCEKPVAKAVVQPIGYMNMKDTVYKEIELTGTSATSIEDAVEKAIKRAHRACKNLCWFQVLETRGNIEKGRVHHWQVTIKVGFEFNPAG